MRIVGGTLRGLKLTEVGPGDPAAHLRPTTDRMREAIFNLLINGRPGHPVAGARVLDLFAGTGALGLEALSRGAAHATFVDDGKVALRLLEANIARSRMAEAQVLRQDATRIAANQGPACDLIFLDPPYGTGLGERALAAALEGDWIAPGAMIVFEEATPRTLPPALTRIDQRRYGSSTVTLARLPVRPA